MIKTTRTETIEADAFEVTLTGAELAVIYGLVMAVTDEPDENAKAVKHLKKMLDETHGDWYPGYYVMVDNIEGSDYLDLHND